MIDNFWLTVGSGCAVLAVSGVFVLLWWSIRQNIGNISKSVDVLGSSITNLQGGISTLQNNFSTKMAELQKEIAKDQKELEARFSVALKEANDRFYGYSARVSELAEAILRQEANMYKEFMPKDAFKEAFNDFRSEIKTAVQKVEHQLERLDEKLGKSLQSRST